MIRRSLFVAVSIALCAGAANQVRLPVIVELFTSEGCSSCPPADQLLQLIDSQVIVLSEHVDYWDQQGWKDKFSSPAFTERQENYSHLFSLDGPYTPQVVIDGAVQFVGGDARRTEEEVQKAARRPKAGMLLDRTSSGLKIDVWDSPDAADVMLVVAEERAVTRVTAGENKGHELRHVGVVRSLRKVGVVKRGGKFSTQVELPHSTVQQRIVVFLQAAGQSRICGAAMLDPTGA